jgi:8-oxo-dGTP diphosphatase
MRGDGFITLADGTARWGKFGAAGVLVRCGDRHFVAQRSLHCHNGGTWAVPGGALDLDETPLEGALREFAEEIGIRLSDYDVVTIFEDDHGGWSYWTIVLEVPEPFEPPAVLHWETAATAWVTAEELLGMELFPAFRAALRHLGVV